MESFVYPLNRSTILQVKAEISRKYLDKSKSNTLNSENKINKLALKKKLKNKSLIIPQSREACSHDITKLDEVKSALERKAEIYESIQKKVQANDADGSSSDDDDCYDDEDLNNKYLVNFQRKAFTDRRNEVKEEKSCPVDYASCADPSFQPHHEGESISNSMMPLSNPYSPPGGQVNFQDVIDDEARELGVAYFPFSRNKEVRKSQMESLKEIEVTAEQERQRHKEVMSARRDKILQKLTHVAAKHGISSDVVHEITTPILLRQALSEETEKEIEAKNAATPNDPSLSSNTADKEAADANNSITENIRPWDLPKNEWRTLTQKEWVSKKRKERNPEFAPPLSFYESCKLSKFQKETASLAHEKSLNNSEQ